MISDGCCGSWPLPATPRCEALAGARNSGPLLIVTSCVDHEMIEWSCPCCSAVVRLTPENMSRITRAIKLRYGPEMRNGAIQVTFNIGKIPDDVDLTEPVDAAAVARVIALCVRPERRRSPS